MSGGEGNEEVRAISHRQQYENQIHILELGAVAIAVIITHSLSAVCTSEPATHPQRSLSLSCCDRGCDGVEQLLYCCLATTEH